MDKKEVEQKIKILLNYFNNEKYIDTISKSKKLLKILPQHEPFLLNIIGLSYQRSNDADNAKSYFLKVINKYPEYLQAKLNYSIVLKSENKTKEAELLLTRIIDQEPNYIQAINNLANLKKEKRDYKNAALLYEKALSINKNVPIIHFNLATCFANLRQKKEALFHANEVIRLEPKLTNADKLISDLTNYKEDKSNHLENMEKKLDSGILNEDQKIILSFALGKAYEDKNIYEESFKFYKLANTKAKLKIKYDFNQEEKFFKLIKEIFSKKNNHLLNKNNISKQNKKIIFICGMPRSGTTLLEQIVSSHKDVMSLGETDYLLEITERIFNLKDLEIIKNKLLKKKDNLYNQYLELLSEIKNKKDIFSDKSLLNYKLIGFIYSCFQDAKIIVLKRKFEDNFLSIYKNYLPNKKLNWSFNEDDISKNYKLFHEYLEFWKTIFPNSFFEVDYEDLVINNKETTESILKYCGLEWDENCLKYYKQNQSPIATASFNQANKPIYKSSIDIFKNFSKFFAKKNP